MSATGRGCLQLPSPFLLGGEREQITSDRTAPSSCPGLAGTLASGNQDQRGLYHFLSPSEMRNEGAGGWKVSKMTTKISTLLNNMILRGWGLPEASLGHTVEARWISADEGPKEIIQKLLAWAGLFPPG